MRLLADIVIAEVTEPTRGGSKQTVITPTYLQKDTDIARAAARKRLLQARYEGWAKDSKQSPNLIGTGGEQALFKSLSIAASDPNLGYRLSRTTVGDVNQLFGALIPTGPIDSVVFYTGLDERQMPVSVTLLFEVKNVRHWIYPDAEELYQLLEKAMLLQMQYPEQLIVPVFICRRRHYLTHTMASELGFFALETGVQPIAPHSSLDQTYLQEVNDELGYNLVSADDEVVSLTKSLRGYVANGAVAVARKWARSVPILHAIHADIKTLRSSSSPTKRDSALTRLRRVCARQLDMKGDWITTAILDEED